MVAIGMAWTAFWVVAPFVSFPLGLLMFGQWLRKRAAAEGFAQDFIPFTADVAAIERSLPKMRGRA